MTDYLYDPEEVRGILQDYPRLRAFLKDPGREGQPSIGFPSARKSPREIFRILGNLHYSRLRDLVQLIEDSLSRGWRQQAILTTRSRFEFDSELAVLRVAEHLWNRGAQLRNADSTKKGDSVPDIYAETGSGLVSIEVYRPRDWLGLHYLTELVRSQVLNVDRPYDFTARFTIKSLQWTFDPWAFSKRYREPSSRLRIVGRLLADFETRLGKNRNCIRFSFVDGPINDACFEMQCSDVWRSEHRTPCRRVAVDGPTLSGHAPEPMFADLIERRVLQKVRKNQHGDGETATLHCRLLFVSIEALGYQQEFEFSWYRSQFVDSVRESFARRDATRQRVDAVAFGSSYPFSITFLCCLTPKAEQAISWFSPRDESQIIVIE